MKISTQPIKFLGNFEIQSIRQLTTPSANFVREWETKLESKTGRQAAIQAAEALAANRYKIHDVGNFSSQELKEFLFEFLRFTVENRRDVYYLPKDSTVKHIVIGHATGIGKNWKFLGSNTPVQDFVDQAIERGEYGWAVACDDLHGRGISKAEGTLVRSQGKIFLVNS